MTTKCYLNSNEIHILDLVWEAVMYTKLKNYFSSFSITNTIIFHNESDISNLVDIIKAAVLPINEKKFKDRDAEKTFLALKYPTRNENINLFLDSPLNYVHYYKYFKGLFVIDLSNYADNWGSDNISRLAEYINNMSESADFSVALLVPCSVEEREKLFSIFEQKLSKVNKLELATPDKDELLNYFFEQINTTHLPLSHGEITDIENIVMTGCEQGMVLSFSDIDAMVNKIIALTADSSGVNIASKINEYLKRKNAKKIKTIGF